MIKTISDVLSFFDKTKCSSCSNFEGYIERECENIFGRPMRCQNYTYDYANYIYNIFLFSRSLDLHSTTMPNLYLENFTIPTINIKDIQKYGIEI